MKFPTDCFNFYAKNYIREEIQDKEEFKISNINNQLRNLNSFSLSRSSKEFIDTKMTITSLKPEENFSSFKDISNIDNTTIDKLLNSKSLNTTNINSSKNTKNTKNTKNNNIKKSKNCSTKKKNTFWISPQFQKRTYRSIMKEMESNLENEKFLKYSNDLEVSLKNLNDKFSEIKIRYACIHIQNWWRSKFKELKIRNYIALNDVIRFFKISKICLNVNFYKKRLLLFGFIIQKLIYKKVHKYFDEINEKNKIPLQFVSNESLSQHNFTLEKNIFTRVQDLKTIFYPNTKSFFSTKITKSYPVNQIKVIQKIFRLCLENKIIIITKKILKPEIFSKKFKSSYKITTIKLIKIQNKIKRFIKFNLKTTPLKRHLCNRGISIFSKIILSRYLINQVILIQRKIKTFLIKKSINSEKLICSNHLNSISKSFVLKNSCKACICRTVSNCICECHGKYSEDKESFFSLISDINSFRTEYKI